jgi:lipid II:glycine glycyltransferase (peptidoglycan interpeptide bridge formation enzyme)
MSYLVFWESLQTGKKLGCSEFDLFGGLVPSRVDPEDHPWKGIAFFKKGMGGDTREYLHPIDAAVNKLKYYILDYPYFYIKTKKEGYPVKW